MRYQVIHTTAYGYDRTVSVSQHLMRLTPRRLARQQCLEHQFDITPAPDYLATHEDYYGNPTSFLSLESAHAALSITASSTVDVTAPHLPDPGVTPPWDEPVEVSGGLSGLTPEAAEFAVASPLIPIADAFRDYAAPSFPSGRPILEAILALVHQIHQDFQFDSAATAVTTPVTDVLRLGRGVCQDFAHLALACLRSLGLPCRYVSGYLETLPPPGCRRLQGADASHAWIAAFCPGYAWIDVDPTNDLLVTDRHITLAWGRDFSDVSPIRGVLVGSGNHRLSVAVDVIPQSA